MKEEERPLRTSESSRKDRVIAAALTGVVTALLLLWLFLETLSPVSRSELAAQSTPEIAPDEELFIEPMELDMRESGEENAIAEDEPAPEQLGEPEPAVKDNPKVVVKGENPKPAPPKEKPVQSTKESPVKAVEPSLTKEEEQRVQSTVANKFSGQNGNATGKNDSSGSGGEGVSVSGKASGRGFLGCPKPDVYIRNKTVVTVTVHVDSEGRVTSATATKGGDASVRKACERAARQARWTAKSGADDTIGTITFTIIPK